jgi:hypothetical protein
MIKNKRANVEIIILVILILILIVACLFVFSFSKTSSLDNFDLSSVHQTNSNRIVFEQSLYLAAEKASIKTFDEFILGEEYDYLKGRKNTGEFFNLNDRLKETFSNRFRDNFLEIFSSQVFYDNSLKYQYEMIKAGKFDTSFDGDNVTIKFYYVSTVVHDEFINIEDSTHNEIKIPLNRVGLSGFNELYFSKEKCKSILDTEEMRYCFEESLYNFDVEVFLVEDSASDFGFITTDSTSSLNLVSLKSKNDFSFKDGIRKVEIAFVSR